MEVNNMGDFLLQKTKYLLLRIFWPEAIFIDDSSTVKSRPIISWM